MTTPNRSVRIVLEGDASSLVRALQASEQQSGKTADAIRKVATESGRMADENQTTASKLAQHARDNERAYTQVGGALTAFGVATTAAFGMSAKAAVDWESAFAGVKKTVDDSAEGYANLSDELRGMSRELPASAVEIAGVAEAAGQLGIKRENITDFTQTMVDLGETTNLRADEAATAIARFANVMGTSQTEFDNIGSAVVELGNNYATTEAEIVELAQRLAGAGRQANLTEGDVLGLATALSSVGIEAEAGGTAYSRVLLDMSKAVDTGSESLDVFADVAGMTASQFSAAWRDDAGSAIAAFVGGLGDMEARGESIQPILEELGLTDIRVGDALRRSASAADLFTGAMETGNAAYADNSALAEEAAKRYETVGAQLEIARNNVVDAAISFGEVLLPAVGAAAEATSDFAGSVSDLPSAVQAGIVGVGGLGGAAALAGGSFLLLFPRVVETYDALGRLGPAGERAQGAVRGLGKAAGYAAGTAAIGGLLVTLSQVGEAMVDVEVGSGEIEQRMLKISEKAAPLPALFGDLAGEMGREEFSGFLSEVNDDSFWARLDSGLGGFANGIAGVFGQDIRTDWTRMRDLLLEYDVGLTELARTSLPQAQAQFAALASETDGTDEAVTNLLDAFPGYRDVLLETAADTGIVVDETNLLNLALGGIAPAATAAAGGAAQLGFEVGLMTPALEASTAATEEQIEAQREYEEMLRETAWSFLDFGGAMQDTIADSQAWAQAQADATEDADDTWEDFYDGQTVNLGRWKEQLIQQNEDLENWATNLAILTARGADALVDELIAMGPEAAGATAQMVDLTDEELQEWNELTGAASKRNVDNVVNSFTDPLIAGTLQTVGKEWGDSAMESLAARLVRGELDAQRVIDAYDLVAELDADDSLARAVYRAYDRSVEEGETTLVLGADLARAQDSLDDWFRDNQGRTISVKAKIGSNLGASLGGAANGGLWSNGVRKFDTGGIADSGAYVPRVSQMGGPRHGRQNILWGEPETGWEAYISGKPGMEERNRQILADAAARLGMTAFANGGTINGTLNMSGSTTGMSALLHDAVSDWFFSPSGPRMTGGVMELLQLVRPFGVPITSTYRPGARTLTGKLSKHAQGKAIDTGLDYTLWKYLEAQKHRFAELYGPWGLWLNGRSRYGLPGADIVRRSHRDHIHLAAYANGGMHLAGLHDGEHVWAKREVDAAGGPAAMYAMRQAVLAGASKYDVGGQVGHGYGDRMAMAGKIAAATPAAPRPVVNVSPASGPVRLTGRLEIGGDGLATMVDARLEYAADHARYDARIGD